MVNRAQVRALGTSAHRAQDWGGGGAQGAMQGGAGTSGVMQGRAGAWGVMQGGPFAGGAVLLPSPWLCVLECWQQWRLHWA